MQQSIIQYQASCKILRVNNTVPLRSGTSKLSKNSKKKDMELLQGDLSEALIDNWKLDVLLEKFWVSQVCVIT
jgi:hypothetical protein